MAVFTRNREWNGGEMSPKEVPDPEKKQVEKETFEPAQDASAEEDPAVWTIFAQRYPKLAEAFIYSFQEQIELLAGKMLDYGTGNMKAGTDLKSEAEVQFALEGVWFRLNDKVQRWKNMIFTDQKPNNESLYDTFMDIANYAIIAKLISRGLWDDK